MKESMKESQEEVQETETQENEVQDNEPKEAENQEETQDTEDSNENQGRDFQDREMHKATCSECGQECEVPFKPSEDRPVYCKDCYMKRRRNRRRY